MAPETTVRKKKAFMASEKYVHVHLYAKTQRWGAWIKVQGEDGKQRRVYLGTHASEHLAARCQDRAMLKLRPKHFQLNFQTSDYDDDAQLRRKLSKDNFIKLLKAESRKKYKLRLSKSKCFLKFVAEDVEATPLGHDQVSHPKEAPTHNPNVNLKSKRSPRKRRVYSEMHNLDAELENSKDARVAHGSKNPTEAVMMKKRDSTRPLESPKMRFKRSFQSAAGKNALAEETLKRSMSTVSELVADTGSKKSSTGSATSMVQKRFKRNKEESPSCNLSANTLEDFPTKKRVKALKYAEDAFSKEESHAELCDTIEAAGNLLHFSLNAT